MPQTIRIGQIKRRETNEEFISRLMNFNPAGGLCQAFIVTAISRFAEACATADPATLDTPMCSGAAWQRCAVHIHEEMTKRFAG